MVAATELISILDAGSPVVEPTGMEVPPIALSVGFRFSMLLAVLARAVVWPLVTVVWNSSAWVVVATELISILDAGSPVIEPTGMEVPPIALSVGFGFSMLLALLTRAVV